MSERTRRPPFERVAGPVIVGATIFVLIGVAILPFLNGVWLGFAQERADAAGWTGWTPAQVRVATDSLLHDLVIGPPDFAVEIDGMPVFDERERGHMRDVRTVFAGFFGLALAGAVALVVAVRVTRGASWVWRAIALAGALVAGAVVVLGLFAALAFDTAFELFHRLLFPAGSYAFDPGSARLVQLLPGRLWYETSLAFGTVLFALALGSVALGRRGAARAERSVTA